MRDWLLGLPPEDYDIATNAPPEAVGRLFPRTAHVGAAFGVTVVRLAQGAFEVAAFRRDGPYLDGRHPAGIAFSNAEEDARRRDFTVNALFLDPETDTVLDYVGGREDLARKRIRAVGEPRQRFEEDHLRLLRAARFSARLGFVIDPHTEDAMRVLAANIVRISPERIRDEVVKMLTEGHPAEALRILDRCELLGHILPEIAAMKGVEQPKAFHPEGDVFEHTLLCLQCLDRPDPPLAMGVLLHDAGKPETQSFEDRIRFNRHESAGACVAEAVCRRLRFSNADTEQIVWLVRQHMRFVRIPEMGESKRKRFMRNPWFERLIELARVDALASHKDVSRVEEIRVLWESLGEEDVRPAPLINGHGLMEMGYAPGPLFREILHAVEDAQLEGSLSTPDEARRFVEERWPLVPKAE